MSVYLTRRGWLRAGGALSLSGIAGSLHALPAGRATADSGPILIGQSTMLTGPLAPTMTGVLEGQALALDEFNARGGAGGRPVKLLVLDDAYDAKRCIDNTLSFIERDRVTALFGYTSTGNIAAVLPMLIEKQVPLIGVYAGSPVLRAKQHPYFFSHTASYRDEVVQMLRHLKTVARTQVALAYMNNAFGQSMLPVVEDVVREHGATLVAKGALEADGGNTPALLQQFAAAKPQALIFMAFGPSLAPFVRAARAQIGAPVFAVSVATTRAALNALGDDARGLAVTTLIPNPFRPDTGMSRDFNKQAAKAGIAVDYDRFWGYLNLRVLLEQIRRAGRTATPQTLVSTIEQMNKIDLGGFPLSYSVTNHHGSNYVDVMIVGPGRRYIR